MLYITSLFLSPLSLLSLFSFPLSLPLSLSVLSHSLPFLVFAVSTLEEQIVQGCCIHQFVPTPSFQASVAQVRVRNKITSFYVCPCTSQIINLVQAKRFVAVCGPSGCGKTAALKVVAEALRQSSSSTFQICHVSITTIAVQAMKEEQLLGYQDEEKG